MRILFSVAAAVFLAGCASLSENECRQGDWAGIGQADGYNGYAVSRLQDHADACRKLGVTPDPIAYNQGREIGLRGYCTIPRGFTEGRIGASYAGVCPVELAPAFMAAYNDGRIVNVAVGRRDAAARARADSESRIRQIDADVRKAQNRLAASDTPNDQKTALRGDVERLRRDRRQAEDRVKGADRDARDAEREVGDLRYRFASRYPGW